MKKLMLLPCICWLMADVVCLAEDAAADDDEYEEIIVVRKKRRPARQTPAETSPETVVQTNAAGVAVSPTGTAAASQFSPQQTLEPPAAEAAEPRRLVRYFCKAWKDEEWERLWWAMTPKFRNNVPFETFKTRFTDDAEFNGGLKDENIADVSKTNSGVAVKVELLFKFENAKSRVVNAVVERIVGGQYRVADSAIIPVDLNDL